MKTKFLSLLILIICQFTVSGCNLSASGITSTELRSVMKFTGIEIKNTANIYLTQGDIQELKIEADENVISHVSTVVKNNILIINSDKDFDDSNRINIYLTVKDLFRIGLSGSGKITTNNQFKCNEITINLAGSGDILATLDSKSLKMNLSGSGNIEAKGKSSFSEIKISGSGNINAKELHAHTGRVSVTGSGTSIVDVTDELNVDITGSGNVYYASFPETMYAKSSGTGKCNPISEMID